jgi:hypothetical protein
MAAGLFTEVRPRDWRWAKSTVKPTEMEAIYRSEVARDCMCSKSHFFIDAEPGEASTQSAVQDL